MIRAKAYSFPVVFFSFIFFHILHGIGTFVPDEKLLYTLRLCATVFVSLFWSANIKNFVCEQQTPIQRTYSIPIR